VVEASAAFSIRQPKTPQFPHKSLETWLAEFLLSQVLSKLLDDTRDDTSLLGDQGSFSGSVPARCGIDGQFGGRDKERYKQKRSDAANEMKEEVIT